MFIASRYSKSLPLSIAFHLRILRWLKVTALMICNSSAIREQWIWGFSGPADSSVFFAHDHALPLPWHLLLGAITTCAILQRAQCYDVRTFASYYNVRNVTTWVICVDEKYERAQCYDVGYLCYDVGNVTTWVICVTP